jgi:hypothetical protein
VSGRPQEANLTPHVTNIIAVDIIPIDLDQWRGRRRLRRETAKLLVDHPLDLGHRLDPVGRTIEWRKPDLQGPRIADPPRRGMVSARIHPFRYQVELDERDECRHLPR